MIRFVETSVFTERIVGLLSDDEYRQLQAALMANPDLGDLMPRCGGARKVRWSHSGRGKGKRGGVRVIYHWDAEETLYMLYVFGKNEQDTLTRDQERVIKKIIKEELS